jgi:sulfur carrier protein
MQLTVNGKPMDVEAGTTISQLIDRLGLADAICAAEVNKAVVPRSDRDSTVLEDGDSVEIVTLVGGG